MVKTVFWTDFRPGVLAQRARSRKYAALPCRSGAKNLRRDPLTAAIQQQRHGSNSFGRR
jgi:hypothetical protein